MGLQIPTTSPILFSNNIISNSTGVCVNHVTEWFSADNLLKEQILSLQMNKELREFMTENVCILLSIGIEFGKVGFGGEITEVKHAGSAKIVTVN